jgi:branched-subunit amino acid ABC-type transport system permease component
MGQQAIHSLALGSIYALLAVGFTFMYSAHRSLYLAYGGLYALGGYVTWWTMRSTHTVWVALGWAVVLCTSIGFLSHWWLRARLRHTSENASLLTGLGLLVCLEEFYRLGIGSYRLKVMAIDSHQVYHIGPLMVTDVHWLVFGGTFALFTAIQGFLSASRPGRALHALLRDDPAIHLMQDGLHRLQGLASGLGAALAGISGVLAGLYLNDVYPAMGTAITHKLLAVVLIGALGSLRGAILVAFAWALIEGVLLPATRLPVPPEAVLLVTLGTVGLLFPHRGEFRWFRGN